VCKEEKMGLEEDIEIINNNIHNAASILNIMNIFMDESTEEIIDNINDDNVMHVKKTMKELIPAVKEMKTDIEVIYKKLKEIKGRASLYRIIKASQDIDRLLKKYMKEK